MDQSLDEWFAEYGRLTGALRPYVRIAQKLDGPDVPHQLRESVRVFSELDYYLEAALVNNGDVFGYVPFIIEHKEDFVAIGAEGTLKALAKLMPFFEHQQTLKDENAKGEYWWRTKDERASAEALAEGVHEFARLLLAYAEKNLPVDDDK